MSDIDFSISPGALLFLLVLWLLAMSLPLVVGLLLARYLLSKFWRDRMKGRGICRWPLIGVAGAAIMSTAITAMAIAVMGMLEAAGSTFVAAVTIISLLLLLPALASREESP